MVSQDGAAWEGAATPTSASPGAPARPLATQEKWASSGGLALTLAMSSADFAPYLSIAYDPSRDALLWNAGTRGRPVVIWAQLSRNVPYYIPANSAGAGEQFGSYTLQLSRC